MERKKGINAHSKEIDKKGRGREREKGKRGRQGTGDRELRSARLNIKTALFIAMQLQQLKFQLRCVKKARGDIKRPAPYLPCAKSLA